MTITDDVAGIAAGDVTFTFTLSSDVGDSFATDDCDVTGATAGAFAVNANGLSATFVVAPPADATGTLTVSVAAGRFEDAEGVLNAAAASASQDYETTADATGTVLVHFEETEPPALTGFGGSEDARLVVDPTDASNQVGRIVKSGNAEVWAGVTLSR